jgi:GST-like protein
MVGDQYTIADMSIWPWYGGVVSNAVYDAAEFLEVHTYTNVRRWMNMIEGRKAVGRGRMVNGVFGKPENQLRERHDAEDFETKTQDKLEPAS